MINITTFYDAYSKALKFFIDGKPLPGISRLSQFDQRPFAAWAPEIFQIAYGELNDDYSMTYVGRSCEARILSHYSREEQHCRSFSTKIPPIPDSTLKRLKKLHLLCMNGLMYKKQTQEINVCTDLDQDAITKLIKSALPKICYCVFKINCFPLIQCTEQKQPFLIIASEIGGRIAKEAMGTSTVECHILNLSDHTGFCGIQGMTFIDKARDSDFSMVIEDILEFYLYPAVLKRMMHDIQIPESHSQYYNFMGLDKMEPITLPVFPLSLEFGQKKEIELRSVPEGYITDPLTYRVSSEEILQIKDNVMTGVGSGEVVIEAYQPGQSFRIATARIKVVRRNRITSINMNPPKMELCVGDVAKVGYSYKPEGADNASTIKLQSKNGVVASVMPDGRVMGRKPGVTSVFAETDNKVKGCCDVTVYPKLEQILLSLESNVIRCGEYSRVTAKRIPENATLDPLIFRVEPKEIAEYDGGSKIIVSKMAGQAVLHATDSRRSVETKIEFRVKKKGLFG